MSAYAVIAALVVGVVAEGIHGHHGGKNNNRAGGEGTAHTARDAPFMNGGKQSRLGQQGRL